MTAATKNIIHKLETLLENMVNEVKDFIDFFKAKHSKTFCKSTIEDQKIIEEPKAYMVLLKEPYAIFLMTLMNQ